MKWASSKTNPQTETSLKYISIKSDVTMYLTTLFFGERVSANMAVTLKMVPTLRRTRQIFWSDSARCLEGFTGNAR